ncbi:hypothetical protein M3Y97_00711100 [Aphelenchoides bicaudatus]|nr:hypothetical protein M3Y97_00711100 [Aphelenchoides bicaudatus]
MNCDQIKKENTERNAYKCALEMLMNVLIYFDGQQNANTKKRLMKLIRDFCFTEQNLREEMQKLLSGRHEPLWTRLKQHFRGERYKEKVDMSRAEEIPLPLFNAFAKELQGKVKSKSLDLHSEFVDLTTPATTQKVDQQSFKPDLRLTNGYFMLRLPNGESIPVNLCSPTKINQVEEEMQTRNNSPVIGSIFGPVQDRKLLLAYNSSKAQPAKAVEKFLREQQEQHPIDEECPFNEENTQRRLTFLLDLISTMNPIDSAK